MAGVLITNGNENGGVHWPARLGRVYADNLAAAAPLIPELAAVPVGELEAYRAALGAALKGHIKGAQKKARAGILDGLVHEDTGAHFWNALDHATELAKPLSFGAELKGDTVANAILRQHLESGLWVALDIEHQWHEHRVAGRASAEHMALFGHIQNAAAQRKYQAQAFTLTTALADSFRNEQLTGGFSVLAASGGSTFKVGLFVAGASLTRSYDRTQTNAGTPGTGTPSSSNIGTDELPTGVGGYTTGGKTLTNADPALSSGVACASFGADPSWTSATFTTAGCFIYNSSSIATVVNRYVYTGDFGGDKAVSAGTFTLVRPSNVSGSALVRF